MQLPSCKNSPAPVYSAGNLTEKQPTLERNKLCEIARSITVVILSSEKKPLGSGFLINKKQADNKQGFLYKVVTNGHVIPKGSSYEIKTADGAIHKAILIARFDENETGDDLAILEFLSKKENYEIAKLASGLALSPQKKDRVLAAGFPVTTGEPKPPQFVCTEIGEISLVIEQPMRRGYSIGYFLDIRKGMSGGPLLNLQGQVVAVNGKNSNPIGGGNSLYVGKDGSLVREFRESRDLIIRSSWAIPMETVVPLARSKGIEIATLPTPPSADRGQEQKQTTTSDPSVVPDSSANPSSQESISGLEQLARQITVRVLIGNPKQSGILIRRRSEEQRQIYTVLTYEKTSESKSYRIQTNDNQIHDVKTSRKLVQGDLLELDFFSTNNYQIASLGDSSSLMGGTEVFTAGYIFERNSLGWADMFKFTKGKIIDEKTVLKYPGSQFIMLGLTNNVQEEMIGGPLLNNQGKLVGINIRNNYISGGWDIPYDENPEYKYSWAIPIEVYKP